MDKKTIKELLVIYSNKADKPLTQWKQSKAKLIAKIESLNGKKTPAKKSKKTSTKKPKNQTNTIQKFAEELILKVAKEEKGIKTGLPYKIILEKVQEKFPDCSTSLNSLRWYAANLNKDKSLKMPIRPISKSEKVSKKST